MLYFHESHFYIETKTLSALSVASFHELSIQVVHSDYDIMHDKSTKNKSRRRSHIVRNLFTRPHV